MNTRTASLPPALTSLRQQAAEYWRGRSARERQSLGLVAVVLAVLFVWVVFVQPALTSVRAVLQKRSDLPIDLRQKVLQSTDELERTVRIRRAFSVERPNTPAAAALAPRGWSDSKAYR